MSACARGIEKRHEQTGSVVSRRLAALSRDGSRQRRRRGAPALRRTVPHLHRRQHARRADAVRRLARDLLHARFPKHDLVVRNLGFSGDEIDTRLRSKNFGTPDEWLSGKAESIGGYAKTGFAGTNTKADVIFAFFGYNESYAGQAGLDAFKQTARRLDHAHAAQRYNGKSAPRVVIFSPIAHEDLGSPDVPYGKENNQRLELYTRAMEEVAKAHG